MPTWTFYSYYFASRRHYVKKQVGCLPPECYRVGGYIKQLFVGVAIHNEKYDFVCSTVLDIRSHVAVWKIIVG